MIDSATSLRASPVLKTLLRGAIDYAGLFPPATFNMASAVREYAGYRNGPDAWALGRFVLPAARLEEFEREGADDVPREASKSWALSALLSSDLEEDLRRIEAFNERHRDARQGATHVDTVELKVQSARDIQHAVELLERQFDTYMEVSVAQDPAELIAAIGQTVAKAKIRTGGVTPDAFPTSEQIARFIQRCVSRGVAFKATAGLHHPWRAEYPLTYASDSPRGTMFGFLNVFLATAAAHVGRPEGDVIAILDERDPSTIRFETTTVSWRRVSLPADSIVQARNSMTSFGSCSFTEPMSGLRDSHLL